MRTIVVALGGNALGNNPAEQIAAIDKAVPPLVEMISQGYKVVISHGNGPQVGTINLAFTTGAEANEKIPAMALPECTAMSQGYIGYHLQQRLKNALLRAGIKRDVIALATQTVVAADDPAFRRPTKPIGAFYTEAEARVMMAADPALTMAEDAGRGWRRMVPSPMPVDIVEKDTLMNLLDDGIIPIACGGGGIPVIADGQGGYTGIAAVVDKDYASMRLAELIGADELIILTGVDQVCINWGKPSQEALTAMSLDEVERYCAQGQFAPGSMLPKIEAAQSFVSQNPDKATIITSLDKLPLALCGKSGTRVYARC